MPRLTSLIFHWLVILSLGSVANAQPQPAVHQVFPNTSGEWARQTLATLSIEQKIGQLFMVAAYTNQLNNLAFVSNLVRNHQIGGIIFMQGGPQRQVAAANMLQSLSHLPLLVAQDAEWGLAMRLDSTVAYPRNLTLGAIAQDSLLFALGRQMGRECRAVGVHVNFGPVVDVNNNPLNPVINDRSFGDDPWKVAHRGRLVALGMQSAGVLAVAKHFPGHGDTDTDSHHALPYMAHSRARLDSVELVPFRELFKAGVQGVMTAHLYIPALDRTPNQATTLSRKVVTGLLVDSLKFNGLIFTDAMNMQGVAKFFAPGEVDARALLAGNNMLLFSQDVPKAIKAIRQALALGRITLAELDAHVYKILLAKEALGIHQNRQSDPSQVLPTLDALAATTLRRQLYKAAITLVHNGEGSPTLPIADLQPKIAFVQVGYGRPAPFFDYLKVYASVTPFVLPKEATSAQVAQVVSQLKAGGFGHVVVGVFEMGKFPPSYGLSEASTQLFKQMAALQARRTVVLFGSPHGADLVRNEDALIVAYEEATDAQMGAAEVVFGAYAPTGRLPVRLRMKFQGEISYPVGIGRFGFAFPEEVGMSSQALVRMDTIANNYIRARAMPGCAIFVLRRGQIVFHKAYGNHTYEPARATDPFSSVYDLASVTKVAATTLAAMRLHEEGKLDLAAPLSRFFPRLAQDPKGNIRVVQLLQHKAGFIAHYPFHYTLALGGDWDPNILRGVPSPEFPTPIASGMYLYKTYRDTMLERVLRLPARPNPEYVYSDIDMILLGAIVEKITGKRLDAYMQETFYGPLGMSNTLFQPGASGRTDIACPPTADDQYFRFRRVEGFVNDDNAACMGGVAGHAGLFSNGYDLLKVGFMLKNSGQYGNQAFLKPETIALFTSQNQSNNRRGLGWDRAETRPGLSSPVSQAASPNTFGHLGYTGTSFWVDPDNDLVFVFLANRTFPNADLKTKFNDESVRIQFMDVVYRSLDAFKNRQPEPAFAAH